jgi:hypothetical protein
MPTLQPSPGRQCARISVMIARRHHSVRSVTFRSRKVYWGCKYICPIRQVHLPYMIRASGIIVDSDDISHHAK